MVHYLTVLGRDSGNAMAPLGAVLGAATHTSLILP